MGNFSVDQSAIYPSTKLPSINSLGLYASNKISILGNFFESVPYGYFRLYNKVTEGQLLGMSLNNKLKDTFSLVESSSSTYVKGQAVLGSLQGICKIWVNRYLVDSLGLSPVQQTFTQIFFDSTNSLTNDIKKVS
jgi:hypothetical protein